MTPQDPLRREPYAGWADDGQSRPLPPAPDPGAGLRERIKADLTALAHLTPEEWDERRGADPIARTINAARDIVDARFGEET